jgi:hypothetical protein
MPKRLDTQSNRWSASAQAGGARAEGDRYTRCDSIVQETSQSGSGPGSPQTRSPLVARPDATRFHEGMASSISYAAFVEDASRVAGEVAAFASIAPWLEGEVARLALDSAGGDAPQVSLEDS